MPSIEENRRYWNSYDWSRGGYEWGDAGHVRQRLQGIPGIELAGTTVEIGAGFGRLTRYLTTARVLFLIDIARPCLEELRVVFPGAVVVEGDGCSIPLEDGAADLIVSYDSLVHADRDAMLGYVRDCARVLRVGGHAWLHHSNLAALGPHPNPHGRGWCSAQDVKDEAEEEGLEVGQELVAWGVPEPTDCYTILRRSTL